MAAFADYLDLQTAVIEQIGDASIADVMPRLVLLAEAAFNRRMHTRDMIASATLTVAGGSVALPADFMSALGLYDAAGCEYTQQPLQMVRNTTTRGFYAISGGDLITRPDGDRQLDYLAKIPTLTASMTATNWLLQRYPGVYLYGVSMEAAKHRRDIEAAQAFRALLDNELADAAADDSAARYSRARVRVAGVTP